MPAEILGRVAPRGAPLPLFGCIVSAGFPSPADDYAEAWLSLDELVGIRAPSTYLVRAGGDSMIGRGIYDGDVLVVDRALDPLPADVVIACVRGDFTVKELTYEAGQPVLMPANPLHQPIRLRDGEELEVWGVVRPTTCMRFASAEVAMYALVDCNNFYVSCERLFRPELRGLPVELLRDGPEDNVATLITHWYMAHKKHSGASDLVAEDLIELAQRVTGQQ